MGMQCTFGVTGSAGGIDDQGRVFSAGVEGLELVTLVLEPGMIIQHPGPLRDRVDDIAQLQIGETGPYLFNLLQAAVIGDKHTH